MQVTDPLAHLSWSVAGTTLTSISPRCGTEGTTFCLPLGRVFLVCPPPQEKKQQKPGEAPFVFHCPSHITELQA